MTSPKTLKQRGYRRRVGYRGPQTVEPDLAYTHLHRLTSQGFTLREVAALAGVHRETVQRIHAGKARKVHLDTVKLILAVKGRPTNPESLVSSLGTQRRLQALAVLGWAWSEVDRRRQQVDKHRRTTNRNSSYGRVLTQPTVTKRFADTVAVVFEQMSVTRPSPTSKTARAEMTKQIKNAQLQGWAPPAAWDDIDDPNEKPKHQLNSSQLWWQLNGGKAS